MNQPVQNVWWLPHLWQLFYGGLGILVTVLLLDQGAVLWVDRAWFASLGYDSVLVSSLLWRLGVLLVGFVITLTVLNQNIRRAWKRPHQPSLWMLLLVASGGFAWFLQLNWWTVAIWIRQVPVGEQDPVFGRDLGFYLFALPFWEMAQRWVMHLIAVTLGAVAVVYVTELGLAKQRLTVALTLAAQRHLLTLTGSLLVVLAWGHALSRFQLLYSTRGTIFGASFTDVNAQLPANTLLIGVALLTAVGLLWVGVGQLNPAVLRAQNWVGNPRRPWVRSVVVPLVLLMAYWVCTGLIGQLYPAVVQSLVVVPNELERERTYIEQTVHFTNRGFNLDEVEVIPFDSGGTLTAADLDDNTATLSNVRLWDAEPLLETYRQLQEIRPYYQFPFVDVDRYTIGGQLRQVMHAAREMDITRVPPRAQTWVNERFFYTHGFGLTLSPVNVVTREGLPDFFISDIPPRASSPAVQMALGVDNPRIYFGEITNTDIIVGGSARELDYPDANTEGNIYGSYAGKDGVSLGSLWHRLWFSWAFRDPRLLISREFNPESRMLFHRQIGDRVRHIAPFLRYDRDPYLLIAEGKLYWFYDAYTTSDHFPYSEYASIETGAQFNYIRNSVKVLIDAYDGTVEFYIFDPEDPIIQVYQNIFPQLFKPAAAMSEELRRHTRYPEDLFQVQAQQYATYHMTDPQVFYNREDQWQVASQFRNERLRPMRPQYLILNLPEVSHRQPEFVLFSPYTPANKDNMVAWMAAGCDGDRYGRLSIYKFSKQTLIFGPQQVEARINQNPEITESVSLWNEHGSRVRFGHLLAIPIDRSIIYAQPLYLEAENGRLPQLTRVIVVYEDRVVMRRTLDEALADLFEGDDGIPEPIEEDFPLSPVLPEQGEADEEMLTEAQELWQEAQEALQQGNLAEFNRLQQDLQNLLEAADLGSPRITQGLE